MSNERAEYVPGNGIDLLRAAFERHVYDRHIHDSYAIGVTIRGIPCSFTRKLSKHAKCSRKTGCRVP